MTRASLNRLVQSLEQLDDQNLALSNIIQVIEMSVLKGLKPAEETLEGVFKMSSALASSEVYTRIENLCRERELVDACKIDEWKNNNPVAVVVTDREDSPTEEGGDIENDHETENASDGNDGSGDIHEK